jgi:ELWxxDGT repeat protein
VRLSVEAMEDRTVPAHAAALGPDNLNLDAFGNHHAAQSGNTLYFLASTGTSSPTLWQTDGTPDGTAAVAASGLAGLSVTEVASAAGSVYFAASTGDAAGGENLYKLDPTAPTGVTQLTQYTGNQGSLDLNPVGDKLYFTASAPADGLSPPPNQTLNVTDGTTAGTVQLTSFDGQTSYAGMYNSAAVGGKLYFAVYDTGQSGGTAVWVSDGTAAGTHQFTGADSASSGTASVALAASGNNLFIHSSGSDGQDQLWVSDGTTTTLVQQFDHAAPVADPPSSPEPPAPVPDAGSLTAGDNGMVYFMDDDGTGATLWASDGTAGGTKKFLDPAKLPTGFVPGTVADVTLVDGSVYFTASDAQHGNELWKADGAGGATLIGDINPGTDSSYPQVLGTAGGLVLFSADDGVYGNELWATDGTAGHVQRVTDLSPGFGSSYVTGVYQVGDNIVVEGAGTGSPAGNSGSLNFPQPRLWQLTDIGASDGAATTTKLTPPSAPAGQPVTLTATVTAANGGAPTGSVLFRDEWTVFGAAPLVNGSATLDVPSLTPGAHELQAVYQGDATFAESASTPTGVSVDQIGTTVGLTSSDPSADVGQPVTLTATVTPTTAGSATLGGTVSFMDGGLLLGTGALTGGVATVQLANLPAGAHTITANYGGDGTYAPGTSAPLAQSVNAGYTVSLTGPSQPAVFGQPVTLTAKVSATFSGPPPVGGTVTFHDGSTALGTATPDATGTATLTVPTLSAGTHSIAADYFAGAAFTSNTVALTVQKATTSSGLTTSAPVIAIGQKLTLTATVAAQAAGQTPLTGNVTFSDGSTVLGSASLANGAATLTYYPPAGGVRTLSAAYAGDANYASSTSPAVNQTVSYHPTVPTTTTLTSSASMGAPGQPVTITARVSNFPIGVPTQVTFRDGNTVLATVPLGSNGFASYTTSSLAVGTHAITASYSGGGNVQASTSAALTETIRPASKTTIKASANSAVLGQAVTLTATVAPATGGAVQPSGTMTFKDGSTVLGTVTLQNGVASFSAMKLALGTHNFSATFAGNMLFLGSSASAYVTVRAAATTVTLKLPAVSSNGATLTLSATLAVTAPGVGTPGGEVTFFDGTTALGTANVVTGQATLQTAKLGAGTHNLTAAYAGAVGFAASKSAVQHYTVASATVTTLQAPPAVLGQTATLKAVVTAVSPGVGKASGTVTFLDGTKPLGSAPVHDGVATLRVTWAQGVGPHTLTASFTGSAAFAASISTPLAYAVQRAPSDVAVRVYPGGATGGPSVTFRATVETPGNLAKPTGSVTLKEGSTVLGTVLMPSGGTTVSLANIKLSKGVHTLTADYTGDGSFLADSTAFKVLVGNGAPTLVT